MVPAESIVGPQTGDLVACAIAVHSEGRRAGQVRGMFCRALLYQLFEIGARKEAGGLQQVDRGRIVKPSIPLLLLLRIDAGLLPIPQAIVSRHGERFGEEAGQLPRAVRLW